MTKSKGITLEFNKEKETKNTVRYQEAGDADSIAIGNLYVQKSFFTSKSYPDRLMVTIEIPEE